MEEAEEEEDLFLELFNYNTCVCADRLELLQLVLVLTEQMRGGLTTLAELGQRGRLDVQCSLLL